MRRERRLDRGAWLGMGAGLVAGVLVGWTRWRREVARRSSPWLRAAKVRSGRGASALVTGASSGIGLAYATKLASMGYDVILVARRRERLEALAGELRTAYGVKATVIPADLVTDAGISTVERAIEATDDLAVLINNAGFGIAGAFARGDLEQHLAMVRVHVEAVIRLTRAALPGLLVQGRGAIVNVSSLMSFYPIYGGATYAGTKCYLRAFTEALHQELVGTGVRVQSLCPGFVRTELQEVAEIEKLPVPDCVWMSPEAVVEGSVRDLAHDRVISVPGWGYRWLAGISGIVPRALLYNVGRWLGSTRRGD